MINIEKIMTLLQKESNIDWNFYKFDYNYYNKIKLWADWYKGFDPTFHQLSEYNGHSTVYTKKSTLNMAKRACEDFSSLITNENISINIGDSKEKDYLLGNNEMTGVLGQNDFWSELAKTFELTCALGTAAFEIVATGLVEMGQSIVHSQYTNLKIIGHNAFEIVPLSWDNNGAIKECMFIDEYTIKKEHFIDLRLHILIDNEYHIINKKVAVLNNDVSYRFVDNTSDLIGDLNTKSNVPWFVVLKLPVVNNLDIKSPLGLSIYGNSISNLESIDESFNTLMVELRHGTKKTFYDRSLLERDSNGNVIYPDVKGDQQRQDFFYVGDSMNPNNDGLIKEFNPTLRIEQIISSINSSISLFSSLVGLGNNYYKFSNGSVEKTATEVISENSSMYRNIRKLEIGLEKQLLDLFRGLLNTSNLVFNTTFNIDIPISVQFDASIIEDKASIRERDLKEVDMGIMTIEEYRSKYYESERRDTTD